MTPLTRITLDPEVMGGKPCIRGLRITVGTIVGLVASGRTIPEILAAYPYLEEADIREALSYAAWRVEETEVPVPAKNSISANSMWRRAFLKTHGLR